MTKHKLNIDPSKISEQITVKPNVLKANADSIKEFATADNGAFVSPLIEAIHAGTTRNFTHYPAEKLKGDPELKSGVYSWTSPYPKPVIYNHDTETPATGRVHSASFQEYTSAGRPGIVVIPKITDKNAIEGIADGRLLTVSIGATTDAAICSICGTDIINEGYCGHMKGESYDGRTAEWTVGNLWFDELSWVNVPADPDAMVQPENDGLVAAESFAFDGADIVNLGKEKSNWVDKDQKALVEGLKPTEEKGDSIVTEEEIKAMQEALDAANEEVKTLKAEKEALETEKTELQTEKSELEDAVAEKTTELETANTTIESLKTEKEGLETELNDEKEAREGAVSENAELSKQIHNDLVERIVDMRIMLGKEQEENKETAVETFAVRSTESLNDSLKDLQAEPKVTQGTAIRTFEHIENPAAGDVVESTKEKNLTPEDALFGLFGGPQQRYKG